MQTANGLRSWIILVLFVLGGIDLVVNASKLHAMIGCENATLTFSCSNQSYPIICFNKVKFNTRSERLCQSYPNGKENTGCSENDLLRYTQQKCHGRKQRCNLLVTSKTMGEHCQGAFKYIMVMYQCVNSTNMKEICGKLAVNTQPTQSLMELSERVEKTKPLEIDPSFSSDILKTGSTLYTADFSTNNTAQSSYLTTTTTTITTKTTTTTTTNELQIFQFPTTRPRLQKEAWGNTSDPVSATSRRPTRFSRKSCSSILKNPGRKIENYKVLASSVNLLTVQGGRKNGCWKLSMHFVLKIMLFCVGFTI